jgi:hypothetical protein
MRISIEAFNETLTTWDRDGGYLVRFRSELTSGIALLAATQSVSSAMCGREITVEVGQRAIESVQVVLPEEPRAFRLSPLPEPGNYEVVGEVSGGILGEDGGLFLVDVCVGDARFTLTTEDVNLSLYGLGDWVRFRIIGLVLWDTNT